MTGGDMHTAVRFIAVVSLALTAPLAAQDETGAFVVRLGTDTIAVEKFARAGSRLEGTFLSRPGQLALWNYNAELTANGMVREFTMTLAKSAAPNAPRQHRTLILRGDSAIVTLTRGDSTSTLRLAAPGGAFPFINHSFALYELVARRTRTVGGDSLRTAMLALGSDAAWGTTVKRVPPDSLALATDNGLGVRLKTDRRGVILAANGHGSTQVVDVERVASVNVLRLWDSFASRPALGQLSSRDTARVTLGGAAVWVDYGRPQKRGREIFGGLVPWNEVWRTGANAATQLGTPADLVIGGATVPAGVYSVWTLPTPTGWKLIFNKQHGQWGTEYHADSDFVRVDLKVETLLQPVERFTMSFDPQGDGAVWRMTWDRTQVSVPVGRK
jgi:DUF2911 family protein